MTKTPKRYLVVSALPYSNGRPHVGHLAGAYLPADIYTRFLRLKGEDVRFICGSDDHGVAILLEAKKQGKEPKELAMHFNKLQHEDFKALGIEFDVFGSTCDNKYHYKASQDFFLNLYEKGYFNKKTSKQFYDPEEKMFLPDRYVVGTCGYCETENQKGDQCEECGKVFDTNSLKDVRTAADGREVEIRETTHWFIDLSKSKNVVANWLEKAEIRKQTKNFVKGLLGAGLVERSMTRDLNWGVPVPLDDKDAKDKVLYVWFDAPIGYISDTMELFEKETGNSEDYKNWWCNEDTKLVHFIGEDNTIFHCIIWIAMLSAHENIKIPDAVIVNQYLNIQFPGQAEEKISKSKGNAPWLYKYIEDGGNPDVLRYYLTSIAPEKARVAYRPDELSQKNNTDLANVLGNLVHRVVSFTIKYYGPEVLTWNESKLDEKDRDFLNKLNAAYTETENLILNYSFKAALEEIMAFGRECNKYLDEVAPWTTRKTDEARTKQSLALALSGIKFLSFALSPIMPNTSKKIAHFINIEIDKWENAIKPFPERATLNPSEVLFTKIENKEK